MNNAESQVRTCPQCGRKLPLNSPGGLCPKCLLGAGLENTTADTTSHIPRSPGGLPQPGEQLGHYSILRLLGQGGMGAVYEAQDFDSGRRVALKILSQALDAPAARERFFREGRLAASINHPNSVYVFGTEEIGGTPVISMELMPCGTLQERVANSGPLPPAEAVDAVLQIIAGLEAAHAVGILHRDIKPSNCFLGPSGQVKIGDFGLSISSTIRLEPALTAEGTFLGTPAFCSPEQLRGDELNARSDMYSVGVTLFYLLTGRTPFEAKNVVQMLATILEKRPPSPRQFRPSIPNGLAKVVLRCLEKQPGDRFRSYTELAAALAPYTSTAPTPATLGLRAGAGIIDQMLLSATGAIASFIAFGGPLQLFELASQRSLKALLWIVLWFTLVLLYYGVLEGFWGASIGKMICRLQVILQDRSAPGFLRAAARACVYSLLPAAPYWLMLLLVPDFSITGQSPVEIAAGFSFYVVLALLFSSARRRNGYAAWHDLLTGTRVVGRSALEGRPVLAVADTPPASVESTPQMGPYHVLQKLGADGEGEWASGYDLRLLRRVWLHRVSPGTPPYPAPLRNISRPGRLRWLAGRRTGDENWDAFEALTGKPLLELISSPQTWASVRFWLHDLSVELKAAHDDQTIPSTLALDHVWVTADNRAKLLDFPGPGLLAPSSAAQPDPPLPPLAGDSQRGVEFLKQVASAALNGTRNVGSARPKSRQLLPLHARDFLRRLGETHDLGFISTMLRPLLLKTAAVTRARRLAILAGCVVVPIFTVLAVLSGTALLSTWERSNPGVMELSRVLQYRSTMRFFAKKSQSPTDDQLALYVAAHFSSVITNDTIWKGPIATVLIKGDNRRFAEESLARFPNPNAADLEPVDKKLAPMLESSPMQTRNPPAFAFMTAVGGLTFYVALPALIAALLFRGGLILRVASVTFARRDGAPGSRARVLWRGLVAWSVIPIGTGIYVSLQGASGPMLAGGIACGLVGLLSVASAALPERGLADRLAGTWPVMR